MWSVCVCVSVCESVGHFCECCKNDWTDRDAIWRADSGGPKGRVLDGVQFPVSPIFGVVHPIETDRESLAKRMHKMAEPI